MLLVGEDDRLAVVLGPVQKRGRWSVAGDTAKDGADEEREAAEERGRACTKARWYGWGLASPSLSPAVLSESSASSISEGARSTSRATLTPSRARRPTLRAKRRADAQQESAPRQPRIMGCERPAA